ncbi:Disease resistance protein [Melia azedarach]|uniref:Disease resistance protein n=1 Tax=Melia azedarach TaxID=155640 RepID=A0ACC1Y6F8_MELAZ|nr:Disease resistance protein [Melia azedarach]
MVDAIISPLLEQLISVAVQEASEQVRLVTGVEKELKKLAENFEAIQAVLADAEERQVKEERVRRWLDKLKYASYDMEDVVDEWNTARLKLQMEGVDDDEHAVVPKKVCSFFSAPCFGFKQVFLRRDIASKIKEINKNLDDIFKQKELFNFHLNCSKRNEKWERVSTTSVIDESEISGRDDEKSILISKLVCESSNSDKKGLHIISLLGMGGIGKTTLAQLAYNNDEVKRSFDKRIWVCVSDTFDEIRIARALIESLESSSCKLVEFQSLINHIENIIVGKKLFLVLDDVWSEDYSKWEPFYCCLKNSHHNSKILITTRKETVAQMMNSTDIICIKQLAEDECWLLFRRIAFSSRSSEECEKLEDVGRKIVSKCKGLPLAAKTIASLLRFKRTQEEWQRILYSDMWKVEEINKGLLAPLLLSYNDLPSIVKTCFSYCAVFPKDHMIEKKELIRLWMAQGYLSVEKKEEMELLGEECFNILAARSFFQEFNKDDDDDNVMSCKMHDMVHDVAQFLRNKECFTTEIYGCDQPLVDCFDEEVCCHSSLIINETNLFPMSMCRAKRLRTVLIYGQRDEDSCFANLLPEVFSELTSVRALVIKSHYYLAKDIGVIPREIEKLIHLRYLNLSCQSIKELPEELCELYNLQILDVSRCVYLKELPQGIGKLISMTHLLNDNTDLRYMPIGITRITNLQILNEFVIGVSVDGRQVCSLESLKHLKLLHECFIAGLGNVSDVGEAKRLELYRNFKNLRDLTLSFDENYEQEGRKKEDDEELLEALQPPPNLAKLSITAHRGSTIWPTWIMSLTNLRFVCLGYCKNCKHLPPLGKLPSLEILEVLEMRRLRRVGNEFLGMESGHGSSSSSSSSVVAFPKLKSLAIVHMRDLEEWDFEITGNGEIMPRLSTLKFFYCPRLKALPDHLLQKPTLRDLLISECSILEQRYNKETGKEWSKISHIPQISLMPQMWEESIAL